MIDKSVQNSTQIRPSLEIVEDYGKELKNRELAAALRRDAANGLLPSRTNLGLGARLMFAYQRAFFLHMRSDERDYELIHQFLDKSEKQLRRYFMGAEPPFEVVQKLAIAAELPIGWIAGEDMVIAPDRRSAKHATTLQMREAAIDSAPDNWELDVAAEADLRLGKLRAPNFRLDLDGDDFRSRVEHPMGIKHAMSLAFKEKKVNRDHSVRSERLSDRMQPDIIARLPGGRMLSIDVKGSGEHEFARDFTLVPRLDIQASAGSGRIATDEEPLDYLAFQADWLKRRGVNPAAARILTARGDSMEETIRDGDILLVDTSVNRVRDNSIYVVVYGDMVLVKRIHGRINGSLQLISDNPRYPAEEVSAGEVDQINIAGRVMWFGRSI